MFTKKSQIITIVMFVCLVCLGVLGYADNYDNGPTVDQIYNSIRHTEAVYSYTETTVTFRNQGMTLVATLVIPNTPKKCPIVITLNGFTGNRVDYIIVESTESIYQRLSRILAEHGVATLRIDFRGSGDSDGDFSMTTFSSQISDVIAAINYIKSDLRQEVDVNLIGVLGFSQGAIVGSHAAAAKSKDVKSLALWSGPAYPAHDYEGFLSKATVEAGLALKDGETIEIWGLPLARKFFEQLFQYDPLEAVSRYSGPMLYVAGKQDPVVWPQPIIGGTFLKYHNGFEKLVVIDAGHNFDMLIVQEKLNDAIYWSTAWFIKTLIK